MATIEQCSLYQDCGFVKWRKEKIYAGAKSLPPDGDCEKDVDLCGRLKDNIPHDAFGPCTREEFDISLPPSIPGSNGKQSHRILGGDE
jgi:hypothetical protein